MIIGEFRVGEDILIALDAVSGDAASVTEVTARMAAASANRNGDAEISASATRIPMAVTFRPATADNSAGWTLLLAAASSASLEPGIYGIDARLVVGTGVIITDTTAFIRVSRCAL
jgi:hypothetical protein